MTQTSNEDNQYTILETLGASVCYSSANYGTEQWSDCTVSGYHKGPHALCRSVCAFRYSVAMGDATDY